MKAFAGSPLEESDFVAAEEWGRRLKVKGHEALVERLRGGSLNLPEIDDWAAIYAIRLLERVGLDVVYDGEQKRTEMYDHVAAFARGFEARGTVIDNKYYAKAAVVEAPSGSGPAGRGGVRVRARAHRPGRQGPRLVPARWRNGPTTSTTGTKEASAPRPSTASTHAAGSSTTWP